MMIEVYGKNVDMRYINRNIKEIKSMIKNIKGSSKSHLTEFNPLAIYTCRICHHNEYNHFINIDGYQYCECKKCKSIFLANTPDTRKLYEGKPDTPVDFYIDKELYFKRIEMIAAPKVEFILNVADQVGVSISQWLDIGCGTGEILQVLKRKGYASRGIESDSREVDFARREEKLDIIEGFVDYHEEKQEINRAIKDSSIISFFNVLEHIDRPDEFLNYVHKNMTNNKLLVFEVPRHPSLASFANLTSNGNVYRHLVPPVHLQVFSDLGIDILLNGKFELVAKWGFGQGFFDLLTNAILMSGVNNNDLYNRLIDASNDIQKTIDKNNLADQMIYVARKI